VNRNTGPPTRRARHDASTAPDLHH
jgi:hypothetical protein